MPYCGERYAGRLKTDAGFTIDKPYGWSGLPSIAANWQWKKLAETLYGEAWDALEALGRVETKLGRGYPRYNEIAPEYNAAREATVALPAFSVADATPEAIAAAKQWTCVLDMIATAMEGYGEKTRTDKGGDGDGGWIWGVAAVVVVGGLVWAGEKYGGAGE
jgi:hypothetical protein